VVGRIGSTLIAGRIDRLLVEAGRVTILDYKTNRPPPTEPHLVPIAYPGPDGGLSRRR
jgi:ATP-dependent helicase/nuclease subunit A